MDTNDLNKVKVGVLMYTYNRTDDAKINQEIIRNHWSQDPILKDVTIVHTFNGKKEWWPEPYLEDELCITENPGHFTGAEILLNEGIGVFNEKYKDITHVIVLASDTWCIYPDFISNIISDMVREEKYVAVSAWGNAKENDLFRIGMSLDLCVLDMNFVRVSNMFPLQYQEFKNRHEEFLLYKRELVFLERVFAVRLLQALSKIVDIPSENMLWTATESYIRRISEREPVHYTQWKLFDTKGGWGNKRGLRTMYWPKIGLLTHHEPKQKQKDFRNHKVALGEHGKKFLNSKDVSYFNRGLEDTVFKKNKN